MSGEYFCSLGPGKYKMSMEMGEIGIMMNTHYVEHASEDHRAG